MVILKDLKQAKRYQIAVVAFTSKGEGPRSSWTFITTGNAHLLLAGTNCYAYLFIYLVFQFVIIIIVG